MNFKRDHLNKFDPKVCSTSCVSFFEGEQNMCEGNPDSDMIFVASTYFSSCYFIRSDVHV